MFGESAVNCLIHVLAVVLACLLALSCTTREGKSRVLNEPLHEDSASSAQAEQGPAQIVANSEQGQQANHPANQIQTPDPCTALPKLNPAQPVYLPGRDAVLTRVLKTCLTRDGKLGIEADSPWLAMGFPCSDGGGRVDVKGNINSPKMVSFVISTDCPMTASNKEAIKKLFSDELGLPVSSKLMAVNPFSVHFWEIPAMSDADTGFVIELRSAPAIEGGWKRLLRDQEKLRVRLFGRENAWVRGDHFFLVEADLVLTGTSRFKLEIASVKTLTTEDIDALKQRCRLLRTARNCDEIF